VTRAGRPRTSRRPTTECGQTSLLIMGLTVICVMLVGVVVDASAAYLRRQSLNSLADGAALAAADGVQGEQVYVGGLGERAQIDPVAARGYVASYLAARGATASYPGLTYTVATTADSVVVRVSAPLDLPFTPTGLLPDPTVTGTAAAFVVVSD